MIRLAGRLLAAAALCAAALAPGAAGAQAGGARFEITTVGDSTFLFPTRGAGWVREGLRGVAVDPRNRDVLVARFTVLEVRPDAALALVTGATRRITTDHVAVLERPAPPPWRQRGFALGLLMGALAGLAIGQAL